MKVYEAKLQYSLVCEIKTESIYTPVLINQYMQDAYNLYPMQESFWVITLNQKQHPISRTMLSLGSINQTIINPPDVFRIAILANAACIAVAHNHPSGDPAPSEEDIRLTNNLRDCGKLLNLPLADHVISGDKLSDPNEIGYYSFHEAGLI